MENDNSFALTRRDINWSACIISPSTRKGMVLITPSLVKVDDWPSLLTELLRSPNKVCTACDDRRSFVILALAAASLVANPSLGITRQKVERDINGKSLMLDKHAERMF